MDYSRTSYITNLDQCEPKAALSPTHRKYHWQVVPYTTPEFSGHLLIAGPETEAPPVKLSLNTSGWHAVYLGLWSNWTQTRLRVKLSDDPAFVHVTREQGEGQSLANSFVLDERFWKFADLTGQEIIFAQQKAGEVTSAYVAYVKLVPLSSEQSEQIQAEQEQHEHRRLICMNDGFSNFNMFRPTTAEELWEWLEPFRDTDFKRMLWCIGSGGDVMNYLSPYGKLIGSDIQDFPRVGDRHNAESLQILHSKGIDPIETVVEYCHSFDMEVHISQRMGAFQCCPPFDELFTGDLYLQHPEWRCSDIDGREIARMSYAFPGVQERVLAIFRELATRYDIDGINPIFNRGAPFLLYETPLVEGFRLETGLDALKIAEDDPRYLRYRARVMTDFMARLRQEMDVIAQRRGKPLHITAHVLNNATNNFFYGLDIPAWVEQGLVDTLVGYPWRDGSIDSPYFVQLTRGTSVDYYTEVMPRAMSPEAYRQRAISAYAEGVDGLCFWDTDVRHLRWKEWSMIRRLGHKEALSSWDDGSGLYFRSIPLLSVGGFVLDKYPPHWAY